MIVGYARVSTEGPDTRQPTSCPSASRCRASVLRESLGCRLGQEGPAANHGALGHGDVLLVTRVDRLARSTRDLLNVLVRCRSLVQDFGLSQMLGLTLPPPMVG